MWVLWITVNELGSKLHLEEMDSTKGRKTSIRDDEGSGIVLTTVGRQEPVAN